MQARSAFCGQHRSSPHAVGRPRALLARSCGGSRNCPLAPPFLSPRIERLGHVARPYISPAGVRCCQTGTRCPSAPLRNPPTWARNACCSTYVLEAWSDPVVRGFVHIRFQAAGPAKRPHLALASPTLRSCAQDRRDDRSYLALSAIDPGSICRNPGSCKITPRGPP